MGLLVVIIALDLSGEVDFLSISYKLFNFYQLPHSNLWNCIFPSSIQLMNELKCLLLWLLLVQRDSYSLMKLKV
jgi:hypothetical protein